MAGLTRAAIALAAGSVGAALLACAPQSRLRLDGVPANVFVDARIEYYDVTAATLTELRRAMREQGPTWEGRRWQAVTQSRYNWTYQYDTRGGGCALNRVRVELRTVVTFPRWNPTAPPDSATLDWWRQLNAGLMEHERGHAQLSVKTAGDIARQLEGLRHGTCTLLGENANAAARRRIAVERREQAEYDRTTRHGATQVAQAARLLAP